MLNITYAGLQELCIDEIDQISGGATVAAHVATITGIAGTAAALGGAEPVAAVLLTISAVATIYDNL